MKIPMEWFNQEELLSAADVKKMNPGEEVWFHQCYGRQGEHVQAKAKIVQSGRKKQLQLRDWQGFAIYKDIKDAENIAYTKVKK